MRNWKRILCVAMAAALACPPVGAYAGEQTSDPEYAQESVIETEQTEEAATEAAEETKATEEAEVTEETEITEETEAVTEIVEETEAVEDEIRSATVTDTLLDEQTVSPNGTYTGAVSVEGNYNLYHFTLPEAGNLSIEMTAWMKCCSVRLYSEDGTSLLNSRAEWNTSTQKSVATYEVNLTAGDYYIRVDGQHSRIAMSDSVYYSTGTFSMKLKYTSAGETFDEPNNDFASATVISLPAEEKGQIAKNDDKDYFKFQVTDAGCVKLSITSYMNYYSMAIYDSSANRIYKSEENCWNEGLKMIQKDYAIDLAPGTYYMLIDGEKSLGSSTKSTGNYSFTMKLEKANVTYTQSDDDFASAYKLSLNKDITGHIAINDKEDFMTFTLSKDTFMNLTFTSYMCCRFYIYDSKGTKLVDEDIGWDGDLEYVTNVFEQYLSAGKYYIKVTGYNSSTGKYVVRAAEKINIAGATIAAIKDQTYTGNYIMPEPVVTYQGKKLVRDVDYIVSYANNNSIGVGSVTVLGCGDYYGNKAMTFNIVGPSLSKASISKISDKTYNGKAQKPSVTVKYAGKTLTKDVDYTVSYKNNKNVGTATVTIKGTGTYSGSRKVEFKINAAKISDAAFDKVAAKTYTGKAIKPSVTVKYAGATLTKDTDYTVSYKDNKNIGTATITVTGKGNFTGTKKITFKITPKKVTLSKAVNNKKGTATVSWKRDKSVTGYELYCSTKKSSGYKLEKTITKNSTTSYADKKLKKGKTYYYKIRAYKTVNGKKVYGSYSSVKSVKINK